MISERVEPATLRVYVLHLVNSDPLGFLERRLLGIPDSALPTLQVIHPTHHGTAILDTIEKDQSQSAIRLFVCLLCSLLSASGIPVFGDYGRHY